MLGFFLSLFLLPIALFAKPYVTADLHGQLGNQLFQIAAAVSLALDHDAEAIFPDLRSKRGEEIPINYRKVFWRCVAKKWHRGNEFESGKLRLRRSSGVGLGLEG